MRFRSMEDIVTYHENEARCINRYVQQIDGPGNQLIRYSSYQCRVIESICT